MRSMQSANKLTAVILFGVAAGVSVLAGCGSWGTCEAATAPSGQAVAGSGMTGRPGSAWDGEYGDVQVRRGGRAASTSQNESAESGVPVGANSGPRSGVATTLPSLADEEARRARREVERVANLARMTELVPNLKAPDWITAGKVVKGDQTILPASGTGNSLKDAYDAAVVSGQRELLKQAGIPATRVIIGRAAYQRLVDGQWQVFVEAVGVGGTGPLPMLARPAPTEKPPVDLIGE